MHLFGMSWSGWLLWLAILCGVTTRCLNMWSYGSGGRLGRFRHDRTVFRTVMPATGLVIGALAWTWGTYGSAAANLVLAGVMLRPELVRRRRWLVRALGDTRGMVVAFVAVPMVLVGWGAGSLAERMQVAGGYQLIVGFVGLLGGAWGGERSADSRRWLAICLSVDLLLGAGAVGLAATPIIVLEAMALAMDLARLTRKVVDGRTARAHPPTAVLA